MQLVNPEQLGSLQCFQSKYRTDCWLHSLEFSFAVTVLDNEPDAHHSDQSLTLSHFCSARLRIFSNDSNSEMTQSTAQSKYDYADLKLTSFIIAPFSQWSDNIFSILDSCTKPLSYLTMTNLHASDSDGG